MKLHIGQNTRRDLCTENVTGCIFKVSITRSKAQPLCYLHDYAGLAKCLQKLEPRTCGHTAKFIQCRSASQPIQPDSDQAQQWLSALSTENYTRVSFWKKPCQSPQSRSSYTQGHTGKESVQFSKKHNFCRLCFAAPHKCCNLWQSVLPT